MKKRVTTIVLVGAVFGLFCTNAQAQEEKKKDAELHKALETVEKALESLTDKKGGFVKGLSGLKNITGPEFREASVELALQGKKLAKLLDLEAMEDDLENDLELTEREIDEVRPLLEEFRGHFCNNGSITCKKDDYDWFENLAEDAEDTLDEEIAGPFVKWLAKRKAAVEACGKAMEKAGEEMGRAATKWAEKFEGDMEEWGKGFEKDMESFGKDMERFGKEMENWGEKFGKDMEKWARSFGEELGSDAKRSIIIKGLDDEKLGKDLREALKGLSVLEEIDWDEIGDRVNEAVEQSIEGIETFDPSDKEFQKKLKKFSIDVSQISEAVRKALGENLKTLNRKRGRQWEEIRDDDKAVIKEELKKVRDKLKKESDSIRSRDTELEALKKEIEELKKEIEEMKRDKRLY